MAGFPQAVDGVAAISGTFGARVKAGTKISRYPMGSKTRTAQTTQNHQLTAIPIHCFSQVESADENRLRCFNHPFNHRSSIATTLPAVGQDSNPKIFMVLLSNVPVRHWVFWSLRDLVWNFTDFLAGLAIPGA